MKRGNKKEDDEKKVKYRGIIKKIFEILKCITSYHSLKTEVNNIYRP